MSLGYIMSEFGNGLYQVRVRYNTAQTDATIARLNAKVYYLTFTQIPDLENKKDDAETNYFTVKHTYGVTDKEIEAAKLARDVAVIQLDLGKAEKVSLNKQIDLITELSPSDPIEVYAWCVDLTEGLVGNVPLIDLNTNTEDGLYLYPGYEDYQEPAYTEEANGTLYPYFSLPLSTTMMNLLSAPAVATWKPTFRSGLLTAINYEANTGTVSLDIAESQIGSISLNQTSTLSDVPIEYMECDAAAFEVGDPVMVRFLNNDWSTPKVIGFENNPKPCGWTEPWDGPNITSKYPWNYSGGLYIFGASKPPPTCSRTITNGIMTMSFGPTLDTDGAVGQYHYLQLLPDNLLLTKNVNTIQALVTDAEINCYDGSSCWSEYRIVFAGVDEIGTTILQYIMKFVYNRYWPHIGCENYDYEPVDWYLDSSGTTSIWWLPGGPHPYRSYTSLVLTDVETYIEIPEFMSEVKAAGIEMEVNWVGGAAYNQPSTIPGGSISIDRLSLA